MQQKACAICCGFTVLVASCIMLALSFALLHPHEYGLVFNSVTQSIETEVKENGRYFLGLGRRFIKFPKKPQYVEFSDSADGGVQNGPVAAWSNDGQEIEIEVGFYFQLQKDKITEIYKRYEESYSNVIEQIAASSFRDTATKYATIDFFTRRNQINDAMHVALESRLNTTVFADVPRFNLLGITVPTLFETAVIDKVVKAQEKNILDSEQQSAVIRQTISVLQAQADRDIRIITAQAQGNGTIVRRRATADAFKQLAIAKAQQHAEIAYALNFTTPGTGDIKFSNLIHYIYMELLRGSGDLSPKIVGNYNKATLPEVLQMP